MNNLQCNLNGIQIQFINWIKIELKINGMQIGGKGIENILVNMALKRKIKTQI
jgi:hypothetical protein